MAILVAISNRLCKLAAILWRFENSDRREIAAVSKKLRFHGDFCMESYQNVVLVDPSREICLAFLSFSSVSLIPIHCLRSMMNIATKLQPNRSKIDIKSPIVYTGDLKSPLKSP